MKNVKKLKSEKLTVIGQRRIALGLFTFTFILFALILLLGGCCCDQPGETTAQGRRRHQRVVRLNQQQMMANIDRVLLLDRPSELTELRMP